jgi:hypothetical protein
MVRAEERHYTVQEIAETWQVSAMTVRRLFQDEPGVLKIGHARTMRRARPHITLRIPASVLERFHEQRSGGFGAEVERRRRAV